VLSPRFDSSAAAEGSVVVDVHRGIETFRRLLLRLPSARPQKGRQALRDVVGDEGWAGADDDYDRAVSFSPAAFTWKRALRNLVELPALWSSIPLLGRDPVELWAAARAVLGQHGAPLPPFVVADDAALTLVWAIEPLRRPREGKPAFHFQCFFDQLDCWRKAAIKLSYAFEPLGASPLDVASVDESLLGFIPLPHRPDTGLLRHAAELGLVPAVVVEAGLDAAPIRLAAVSRPLRRLDERLFAALGRPPAASGARRRWRDSDVSRAARVPQTAGARHPAALKLVCANRWDGLSREANLADLRAWAATCQDDGAFPARAGVHPAVDELEALVDWAEKMLQPGGPTPRSDAGARRRPRRRTSRDHVAAVVCGFLAESGGAFEGALEELGKRAALWALDHGVHQPVPLRTLKRAVVDLVALGELVRDVVRVGSTWRSSFVLRSPPQASSSPPSSPLSLVAREKDEGRLAADVCDSPGQQSKSMWSPAPGPSLFGLTIRGGPGGAVPLQGGSGGERALSSAVAPSAGAPLSDPRVVVRSEQRVPTERAPVQTQPVETQPSPVSAFLSSSAASPAVPAIAQTGRGTRSARQRRLPLPRSSRAWGGATERSARAPGEGLPPLDATIAAALADVGRHLSSADHDALLQEARAGLFARPRVLADFVGALRRRALRILRLREIASASAAHLLARQRAEARAAAVAPSPAPSPGLSPGLPSGLPPADEGAADVVFADFRRMLAAQVKPLHERTALDRVRRLYADGLSLLALPARSKKPAGPWKQQQQQRSTLRRLEQELESLGADAGLAVVCGEVSGVVVADFDDADAVAWAQAHLPDTPWKTRTARGEHWYYRLPFDPTGAPFVPPPSLPWKGELRAAGHYVVAPGSWHPDGVRYVALGNWSVPREALPTWSSAWVVPVSSATSGDVERLRALRERIWKGDR
jgi:hypothetical protein